MTAVYAGYRALNIVMNRPSAFSGVVARTTFVYSTLSDENKGLCALMEQV